jgi:hypothetical protein
VEETRNVARGVQQVLVRRCGFHGRQVEAVDGGLREAVLWQVRDVEQECGRLPRLPRVVPQRHHRQVEVLDAARIRNYCDAVIGHVDLLRQHLVVRELHAVEAHLHSVQKSAFLTARICNIRREIVGPFQLRGELRIWILCQFNEAFIAGDQRIAIEGPY